MGDGYDIVGDIMQFIMVLDKSCISECKHCYANPGRGNVDKAKEIALDACRQGYNVFFYPTMMTEQCFELQHMLKQENDGFIAREDCFSPDDERLKKYFEIELSLHGSSPEIHDLLVNKPGSFNRTIDTIKRIRNNLPDLTISIWMVVHKKNYHQLAKIADICYQLGVRYLYLVKLSYLGRAKRLGSDWFLEREEISEVIRIVERLNSLDKFSDKLDIAPRSNWGLSLKEGEELWKNGQTKIGAIKIPDGAYCTAGRNTIAIDSYTGYIYPCHLFSADKRFIMGRWENGKPNITNFFFKDLNKKIGEPCHSCDLLDICGGGCRAEAISENERKTRKVDIFAGLANCRRYLH